MRQYFPKKLTRNHAWSFAIVFFISIQVLQLDSLMSKDDQSVVTSSLFSSQPPPLPRLPANNSNHTEASSSINKHKHSTNNDTRVSSPPSAGNYSFIQPTDPIMKKHNSSTTPIVIEEYKLLFFTVEKIGSTVLKQLMRRMMHYENYDEHSGTGIPHMWPKNGLKYIHQYTLEEANEMMTSPKWTRAMFVRDPKERSLSAFLMWRPDQDFTKGGTIGKSAEGFAQ